MKKQIKIVVATEDDSHDIWSWRNDPDTIKNSNSPDPVAWDNHAKWYNRMLMSNETEILIGKVDGDQEKIGMVRFDKDEKRHHLVCSINLNPKWRGKGLAADLLKEAIAHRRIGKSWPIYAEVKPSNQASIRCFEKNAFQYNDNSEGINRYLRPPAK